jgi:hypothetical protein
MRKFAKLCESDEMGQLLVKIDSNDKCCPEIRVYFNPEGLGVCSIAVLFTDDEDGWDQAEKMFEVMDEVKAETIARVAWDQCASLAL